MSPPARSMTLATALTLRLALFGLLLLLPVHAWAGSGTDAYGYEWIDSDEPGGPTPGMLPFDPTPNRIDPGGSDLTRDIALPFIFPFYGQTFQQLRVSTNGFITFDMTAGLEPTNKTIPLNQTPDNIIAYLWDDLTTNTVQWGTVEDGEAFQVQSWGFLDLAGGGTNVYNATVTLYPDGRIRIYYLSGTDNGSTTVGIESPAGLYGIQNLYNGQPIQDPGRASLIERDYTILYTPPTLPDCTNAEVISCGATPSSTPASEPTPPTDFYSCSPNPMGAWEKVFELTLTRTSQVTASLSAMGSRDLRIFLLSPCNAVNCIAGGTAAVDFGVLAAGTYYIVVDGPGVSNNGAFTLNLDCTEISQPIQCGDTVSEDTTGGTYAMDGYPCAPPGRDFSGPERFFDITLPAPTHLFASIDNPDQDVLILPAGSIDPATCISWGDDSVALFSQPAGDYTIVVDGPSTSAGPFNLEVECGPQLDCVPREPMQLICGSNRTGATIPPGPSSADRYICDEDTWLGPEHVYDLQIGSLQDVIVLLESTDDVGAFLLDNCDEGSCLGGNRGAACAPEMNPGLYTLAIDSLTTAGGTYDISIACNPRDLFHRWSDCEDPRGDTTTGDTVRQRWQYNDLWYCIEDDDHRNNPPGPDPYNECYFAMYAVVECGTEMHLPMLDVESGRLRIYDVLNERYVHLYGRTPTGWSQDGMELQWKDAGCPGATAGNDPRFEDVVNDIHFFGEPQGAPVCGVFRMEFYDWGGFVWDLFSNCSGNSFDPNREVHFDIYDNVCDAVNAFQPKPELSILNPRDDGGCPNVLLDFDIANTGCVKAEDFVINIYEELETGGDELKVTVPVPLIQPGQVIHFQQLINLSSSSSPAVRIEADGNDNILECSEAAAVGNATACRPQQGQHDFRFPVCDECTAIPVASANPARLCTGGSTVLSGAGSSVPTCAGGVPLEYNWTTTPVQPGPGDPFWTTSETMDIPVVDTDTTWYLWVRCQNDPGCVSAIPAEVLVEVHTPPVMGAAQVFDPDICDGDLQVEWASATFYHDPANGPGVYNIYRAVSTGDLAADCDTARNSAPIITGLTGNSYLDITTSPNETYVYIVQAEDAEPANPCLPPGPVSSGATDDECVGPVWDEVDRTPPATDVGNYLRALDGDQNSVSFEWQDPRAAGETRERFRAYRSENVIESFQIVGDMIDNLTFTDPNAPAILYFYDVRTVDTCGNVADDPFPPDQTPPASCSNLELECGASISSSTATCFSDFDSHDCFARDAAGPDRFHSLRLTSTLPEVRMQISSPEADLDLYVYDATLANCLDWGDAEVTLFNAEPGRYWVVVDGAASESGLYTIDVSCP